MAFWRGRLFSDLSATGVLVWGSVGSDVKETTHDDRRLLEAEGERNAEADEMVARAAAAAERACVRILMALIAGCSYAS